MSLKSKGFENVLNSIKNATDGIVLYGKISQDDFATEQDYETQTPLTLNWKAGTPSSINDNSWKLESDSEDPTVFTIDTSNGKIRVAGIRLLDSSDNVLVEKGFGQTYEFDVDGELTVEQIVIEASS